MAVNFSFQEAHFNRIFPFYILFNHQMVVESNGKTLEKIFAGIKGKKFEDSFTIQRPKLPHLSFNILKERLNELLVIECRNELHTILRGQIEYLPDTNQLLFIGSPWFGSIEEVLKNNLSLNDFARHDSMTDLLHVLKAQENTNDDLTQLLGKINSQKNELKAANKAIHDIALFPTQNPDPLIRINFEGDVIQNNPAASRLDFIKFENITYRNDEFFKLIIKRIDTDKERWEFEADSENSNFSFVCIPMKDEGYINIYGRDISQQKKDQEELKLLSHIIQQTVNAVIVTDAKGHIEWVNNAFNRVTGYRLDEVKGKTPGRLLQGPETDPAAVLYMREKIKRAEAFTCEIYNYKKSGEGYWLRINGQPIFDNQGNVIQFFAIEEDITKERAAEAKLEEFDKRIKIAMQKIGDNVWEHDFTSEETTFSQQEYNLLGYSSDEFNSNVNLWYSCIHEEDKPMLEENDVKYRTGQIDHHTLEYRMLHKDGSVKWVLDRGAVIEKTFDGKPVKIIGTHSDITQQKAIEKELEQRVQQFYSLSENIPGVIYEYEFRPDGTQGLKYVSPSVEKVFGLTVSQFQQFGTYIHPDDLDSIIQKNNESRFLKKPFVDEARLIVPGKGTIWHSISSSYSFTAEDGTIIFTGFMMDITERKNAEQKIEEQKAFYEHILNNLPADIAVFDKEHRYLFLNPKAISDEEFRKWMIGKKDEDYIRERNKPLYILEGRRKVFNEVVESKVLNSWEEELPQPDGTSKFILRNMFPVLDTKGEVDLVIGYAVDISNIKNIQQQAAQSEKRYRDLIDNSLAIVTTHDLKGRFISVNPMVGKVYGYNDAEIVGHGLIEFMPEDDRNLFEKEYLQKIKIEKRATGIFRVIDKNGKIIYSLYNNFLKEEPGKEPYVIGFAVDITDRIKAEKELKIAKKITEELAQSKQNFLANMSHEIRTPMNAIMGMAGQLGKTLLNKEQHFFLDTITTASENLLVIINDILDFSKIEAGKLVLEQIGFEPKLMVERAMRVMKHKAEEKGLDFTNSFLDSNLNGILLGDPYRMNQILLNLISNSIKFTEKGTVDISCKVIEDSTETQTIYTVVKDTGIGMDEAFTKNLFQKFSQEDESVTRRHGGTGLGMSICKELVELMGGSISVVSKKGAGTSVAFTITFAKGKEENLPLKDNAKVDVSILAGKVILVTDDNDMNRLVASTILTNYGAAIIEARNGVEAIQALQKQHIDIVLMDIQMPVMDGIEAIKEIRQNISKDLPVIALTAFAIKGDSQNFINAGMNDYLSKPFEENQLLRVVTRWLGKTNTAQPNQKIFSSTEPLFNLSKLEDIAKGNTAFVNKMITLFKAQAPSSVAEIKEAYFAKDFEKVKKIAHRLKPSIDNLGISSLKNEIRSIEKNAETLQTSKELEQLISNLETVINEVVITLKNIQ